MSIVPAREALLSVLVAVVAVALGGCGSLGGFDPGPAHSVDLSGSWLLDRTASDDPQKWLDQLQPKGGHNRQSDIAPDDSLGPPDDDGQSGGQGGNGGPRGGGRSGRGRSAQRTEPPPTYVNNNEALVRAPVVRTLLSTLARGEQLTVRQGSDEFSLDYGTSVRRFTPGAKSVVSAAWGVADQSSGWKGKEYIIQVKPQTGVAEVETYGLSDDGKQLIEQLRLGGGEYPVVKLKRVYDRTDRALPRVAPTND
jgi:hypothetical protein